MSHTARYLLVMALTLVTFVVEVAGTLETESLGLLSDALHLLADNVPLVLGLWVLIRHKNGHRSSRHEALVTNANVILLIGVGLWVGYEVIGRLADPPQISPSMLAFAFVAMLGNGLQWHFARGLRDAHMHAHTGEGQVLHLAIDFLASASVLVGAFANYLTRSPYADIAAATAVVIASFLGAWHLRREVCDSHSHADHHHHHH